jgi:formylglycine-generating enzyme required for sulfatase activity
MNIDHKKIENLIVLIRSDDYFDQGINLCRKMGMKTDTLLDALGFSVQFVTVPGGSAEVGENESRATVNLEEVDMAATMTTVAQWVALRDWVHTGSEKRKVTEADRKDTRPVVNVTAFDAEEYCRRLTLIYNLDDETVEVRLPHSAEWEVAAKGGENYAYAGSDDPDEVAWYSANSNYQLQPVGLKKPNGYGLYDMSGNAYTWTCTEWDSDDPSGAKAYMQRNDLA